MGLTWDTLRNNRDATALWEAERRRSTICQLAKSQRTDVRGVARAYAASLTADIDEHLSTHGSSEATAAYLREIAEDATRVAHDA